MPSSRRPHTSDLHQTDRSADDPPDTTPGLAGRAGDGPTDSITVPVAARTERDLELAPALPGAVTVVQDDERATAPVAVTSKPARKQMGVFFWLCLAWFVMLVVVAITANVLPLKDPLFQDYRAIAKPPSFAHPLGTDELGRDMLSRAVFGARVSLIVSFFSVVIGMFFGGLMGMTAGYFRGRIETLIMGLVDTMLAFPALVLALAIITFMGQNLRNVTIAIGVIAVPAFARVARASTLAFAQREFVLASRAMGARSGRIIFRELLPNVVLPVAAFALVVIAVVVVAEGGLAFLGLSVPLPKPSWGSMIAGGRAKLATAPHISLIPSGIMFLTVMSVNFVGDRLRGLFDVKEAAI